ncbi:MAG: response regulator [Gammaproteobacteria bacterium]|nr:response regulator [Gammaproteobacteria bacterium]
MPAEAKTAAGKSPCVLIIDDHTLFRSGLQELLERRGIRVVGTTGDGEEGCALARKVDPDVILLDVRMPGMGGLSVLERLNELGVKAPVLMLTTSTEDKDLIAAVRGGAKGYLLKDLEPEELISSIGKLMAGECAIAPEMTGVLARVVHGEEPASDPETGFSELTAREMEILCHLAEGQSNKVIARELGISNGTVKLHVRAILRKLQVRSRVEAAVRAVEEGIGNRKRT